MVSLQRHRCTSQVHSLRMLCFLGSLPGWPKIQMIAQWQLQRALQSK